MVCVKSKVLRVREDQEPALTRFKSKPMTTVARTNPGAYQEEVNEFPRRFP